jgi:hypothetical protein
MKIYIPTKEEVARLLEIPDKFRGIAVCENSLPPDFILKAAIVEDVSEFMMPRLFCDEKLGLIIGSGGFKSAPNNLRVEIGYNVAPRYRNRGYATEGVNLLVQSAFKFENIKEVVAEVLSSNISSARVLEKLEFVMCASYEETEGKMNLWERKKR